MAGTPRSITTVPLLRHSSPDPDFSSSKESLPHYPLHALHHGHDTAYASDSDHDDHDHDHDHDDIAPPLGFWKRLTMSIRRRNGKPRPDAEFGRLRLPDEKKQANKYRLRRKHATRACVIIPLLIVIFL